MELSTLTEYVNLLVTGICLCIGYMIKTAAPNPQLHRFIPIIMGGMGLALLVWIRRSFDAEVLLTGLISGLASTGLHQAFCQLIDRDHKEVQ